MKLYPSKSCSPLDEVEAVSKNAKLFNKRLKNQFCFGILTKILVISIISIWIFNISLAKDKYQPVVKVESYKSIFWKYIEKTWWWSASVISDNWYIVTNNHVVDDGAWNVSDYFSICLTYDENKKPDCNYTATLVDRDKNLDVALLKINPKDNSWNNFNYSDLEKLEIDFEYDIKSKDEVYAIWYPWIWSETMTKTKWIISWTVDYNSYQYIKSDTLIAWWNSWWALISKDNKLIWIPTFIVWWWFSSNIWYSVSVKETKTFLEDNLKKQINDIDLSNFITNKSKIDKINNESHIDNSLVDFNFPKDYEVTNYAESKLFVLEPKLTNENLITNLWAMLIEAPELKTEEDFLYYLKSEWIYNEHYYKLKKMDIWGLEFFQLVVKWDTTWWESYPFAFYIAKLDSNRLIFINVWKPVSSDSDKNKIISKNLEDLLSRLNFKKGEINNVKFDFDINSPELNIKTTDNLITSDYLWIASLYLWNLHDIFSLSVKEFGIEDWKWKDIEDIYKNETIDIDGDYKSMIEFKGHKWFIYCDNYDMTIEDEKWWELKQNSCTIKIYDSIEWNNGKEYYIVWDLISNKNNIDSNLDIVLSFLKNNISINEIWDSQTNLVNVYKNINSFSFTDLNYQSDDYKDAIQKLLKYQIIKDSNSFDWDKAIKWKEFLVFYFESLYNYKFKYDNDCVWDWEYSCLFKNNYLEINWEKKSMFDTFLDMNIPLDEYVDYKKVNVFMTHMELVLSWIKENNLSEKWLSRFMFLSENSVFEKEKQQMDSFKNKVFWKENVYIWELLWKYYYNARYFQENNVYYVIDEWKIVMVSIYDNKKYNYSSKKIDESDKYKRMCEMERVDNCYKVMTKSLMIDLILPKIDFTLFDESLKNNKKSVID